MTGKAVCSSNSTCWRVSSVAVVSLCPALYSMRLPAEAKRSGGKSAGDIARPGWAIVALTFPRLSEEVIRTAVLLLATIAFSESFETLS